MRRVTAVLSATAVATVMTVGLLAQAHPNFAGKWTVDASAMPAAPAGGGGGGQGGAPGGGGGGGGRGGGGGGWGMTFTITQDATSLTVDYTMGGQTPTPVKAVFKLDGSESHNKMMARGAEVDQVSKAMWDGAKLKITTTGQNGDTTRVLSMDGAKLSIETTAPARGGGAPTPVTMKYTKG